MNPKNNSKAVIIIAAVLAVLLTAVFMIIALKPERLQEFSVKKFYMDTFVEIKIIAPRQDSERVQSAFNDAFAVFEEIDRTCNFQNKDSELYKVNRSIYTRVENQYLRNLIHLGIRFSNETNGVFDFTLGSIKLLYPIGKENPVPPEDRIVKLSLMQVGYEKIRFRDNLLRKPAGILLDFGGIAKGYAVDMAANKIKQKGFSDYMINAGGNIYAAGKNAKGASWKIGIENPRKPGDIIGTIILENQAVATSGDYQRYFFYNNKRYHHIIDPKTGYPAEGTFSATIIAPDATSADAFSTAVFIMGRKDGITYLENKGLKGIVVDETGITATKNIDGIIELKNK